ncbi:hypothetical protein AK830_g1607 [Neonectria ditissima]|uniref:ASCH domain-containing protein n=1 Tax=Neonectria ditissima TaxID=78410 RepID=A0A0P7BE69_9HYPO|nr:hypothetical protein AK830_g1607 [Neonectria ditissima]
MAPQVCKSDIIIAIHPRHIANIVSRTKNHEFRKYLLPTEVRRLWIYETSPASSVKYVATISAGKRPGEIRDPSGLRNDEFDEGRLEHLVKFAYEIHRLEALTTPISLGDLKQNGWLNGPPQKYCYVKQPMRQALSVTPLTLIFDSITMVSTLTPSSSAASSDAHPDAKPEHYQSSLYGKGTSSPGTPKTVPVRMLPASQVRSGRPQGITRRPARNLAGIQKHTTVAERASCKGRFDDNQILPVSGSWEV